MFKISCKLFGKNENFGKTELNGADKILKKAVLILKIESDVD